MIKRIRILTVLLTIVPSIVLALINYTYGLGFLLGGLLSTISFEMIVYSSNNAPLVAFTKSLKRNRVFRSDFRLKASLHFSIGLSLYLFLLALI